MGSLIEQPPVVGPAWLGRHRHEVVVADVRWYLDGRSGAEAYRSGHIAGAVFVDLDHCLAGPPSAEAGRHPLPAADDFARAMSGLGIGDTTRVVAYDDAGGTIAARMTWMLRATGHSASILDGGIQSWPGALETGPGPVAEPSEFHLDRWPTERLASADDVVGGGPIIDARAPQRYRGEVEPVDQRAGHIPGAVNAPTAANLDERGWFKPAEVLRARYADLGAGPGSAPIVYCGSGVTACHDLIALEVAGYEGGRLYPGSWSQWSADPARPVQMGD